MVQWNLSQIQTKIRNLTGTPIAQDGTSELSNLQLTDYINSYYAFTMPFELKEQINQQPLQFTTTAGQDVYPFPGTFLTNQPYAYADGYPCVFYQDIDIFLQDWPIQLAVDMLFTGNGVTKNFVAGAQNPPIIAGTFIFTDGVQVLSDQNTLPEEQTIATGDGGTVYAGILAFAPIQAGTFAGGSPNVNFRDDGAGNLDGTDGGVGTINYTTGAWEYTFIVAVPNGNLILAQYDLPEGYGVLGGNGTGTVNYTTGAINATFNSAPPTSATIYAKYQGYQGARPQAVLFYNNVFTLRPVPDQVYEMRLQGYISENQFLNPADVPTLAEWGQLIAYGATLEIFADRGDLVAYNNTYPLLKRYENVALARYVQQMDSQQAVPRF